MTLLKKVADDWAPSENPKLKIGETIEITDPKELILAGTAVAVGSEGEELGAFELYGVITDREKKEFESFKAFKNQKNIQKKLETENKSLNEQANTRDAVETNTSLPAVDINDLPVPTKEELRKQQLVAQAAKMRAAKNIKK